MILHFFYHQLQADFSFLLLLFFFLALPAFDDKIVNYISKNAGSWKKYY